MGRHKIKEIAWREVCWRRPIEAEAVCDTLSQLAGLAPRGAIVWEIRGRNGTIRYLAGAESMHIRRIEEVFRSHGEVTFQEITGSDAYAPATIARRLKISHPQLSIKTDTMESVIRAGLAALSEDKSGTETVLQVILGGAYSPAPTSPNLPDPHTTWLEAILGNVRQATPESRKAVREKAAQHSFQAMVRIGTTGNSTAQLRSLLSALRTLESAGVRICEEAEKPENLNAAYIPWHFPLHLSIKELANFFLLPVGDGEFPGTQGLHPRLLLPPCWYRSPTNQHTDRSFAVSMEAANPRKLSISPRDGLEHTILLGPTGSGKSTAMEHLILSDIRAGRSVLVIDPKADLVNDILERIPRDRADDVVVLDPSDACPAGFNPLAFRDYGNPSLLADSILSVFREIWADSWGVRIADILNASLLTLVETEGATLLWLPPLLTDGRFRRKITSQVRDITLKQFWEQFDALSDRDRKVQIEPVLNKIRQFLLRPSLRNVLGQTSPKFSLMDLFTKRRIVLVPLNKGLTGGESARLIGSLIVGLTWTLALSRAKLPPEKRHIVSLYIDELQDYLSLPTDLSDALAQARGLGLGLILAHQYRDQLSPEIRAGIDANCRNKICFGLSGPDARAMAAMAPELEAEDFMKLPRYQVYASFQSDGRNTGWVQGKALTPLPAIRSAAELKAGSMSLYGMSAEEVEREYLKQTNSNPAPEQDPGGAAIGRRKR